MTLPVQPADTSSGPQPRRFTALALLFAATLTIMAGATIAPSLPAMSQHFSGVPQSELLVRLVLTLPALIIALASPIMGNLSDRLGRKPLLLSGMALYVLAGVAGFFIGNIWLLLLSRGLLGVAVAAVMTANTALMADLYQGEARSRLLGMQGVFSNIGGTVFLVLGGFLAQRGWQFPFLIYLIPVLILPLIWLQVPATRAGDDSPAQPAPLPMQLLWPVYAAAFLTFLMFYLIPTQLPFYLHQRFGTSAGASGFFVALTNIIGIFAGFFYARVSRQFSPVQLGAMGLGAIGLGLLLVGLTGYYGIALGVLVVGLGVGFGFPNFTAWLVQLAPPAVRGKAIGFLSSSLFMGQFLSPILAQPIIAAASLRSMFWIVGVLALVAGLLFSRIKGEVA